MILDDALKLGSSQAVDDTDAYMNNTAFDNDSNSPHNDLGAGTPMCVVFQIEVAAAGSTDTSDFIAVQSDAQNLAGHAELAKRRVPNAQLTVGTFVIVPIPPGAVTKRWIGGRLELGTGDTATVSCWGPVPISSVQQSDRYYMSGFQA